jgi:hypothetical protein
MSEDSPDFRALRRLLTLKRYEQPPPGYFHRFSGEVMARIEAGDTGEAGATTRFFWDAGWLQRLWSALEAKPVVAGAFGLAVCSLLIWGVISSEKADIPPIATLVQAAPPVSDPLLGANEANSEESLQAGALPPPFRPSPGLSGSPDKFAHLNAIFGKVATPEALRATLSLPVGN